MADNNETPKRIREKEDELKRKKKEKKELKNNKEKDSQPINKGDNIESSEKQNVQKKSKKNTKKKRPFYKKFRTYVILFILLILGIVSYAGFKLVDISEEHITTGYAISASIDKETLDPEQPTIIYDRNGEPLKTINTYAQYQEPLDNINPYLSEGFIAVEDIRFSEHNGVDLYGTSRAMINLITGGSIQGGSTITQQLVKNKILKNSEVSVGRKISEMVVAQELEDVFSKDEILESYLNSIYFGRGATGVGAAAQRFFSKDQSDLNPREASVIIGLTNNPTLYDPIENPDTANKKSETILGTMYRNGVLTEEEYQEALDTPIEVNLSELSNSRAYTDDYAVGYAIHKSAENLGEVEGFEFQYIFSTDEEYRNYRDRYNQMINNNTERITSGGYEIHTTIDAELQRQVEESVKNTMSHETEMTEEGSPAVQASVSVVDNNTHDLVAIVGGRGTEYDQFNRAYLSYRQPGSAIKPLFDYTPALMNGMRPDTKVLDSRVEAYPHITNWWGDVSNQEYTLREALGRSLNTVAVKVAMNQPLDELLGNLGKMQFGRLHPNDQTYVVGLGGMTYGTNTIEMASGYSTLVNQGIYHEPSNVSTIVNSATGETVYERTHNGTPVYTPSASYMMLDMLKTSADEMYTQSPSGIASNYPEEYQGGKTGTTNDYRDMYFAAVNSHYSSATWVGRDDNKSLAESQRPLARHVSRNVNNILLNNKEPIDFEKPDTVKKLSNGKFSVDPNEILPDATSEQQTNHLGQIEELRLENQEANLERLSEEDYRIIYGLSEEEEEAREQAVIDKIELIESVDLNRLDQFDDLQTELSKAYSLLTDVKHQSARSELEQRLNDLQISISNRYSELLVIDQSNLEENRQQQMREAKREFDANNESRINELKSELDDKVKEIENLDLSDNNLNNKVNELDDIVDELNKLGEPTGYFTVRTDGNLISIEQNEAPEVEFTY